MISNILMDPNLFYYIIILIVVIMSFIMVGFFIKLWYNLRNWDDIEKMAKGNKIALSKLKGSLKEMEYAEPEPDQDQAGFNLGNLPDLTNMSLDQAVTMLGIDPKELKNPITRGLAEGFFNKIKDAQQKSKSGSDQENWGY